MDLSRQATTNTANSPSSGENGEKAPPGLPCRRGDNDDDYPHPIPRPRFGS